MMQRAGLLAILLCASAAYAGLDIRVGNGDVVTGTLSPGTESETLRAVIPKDALVSVTVKGLKTKGSADPAPVVTFALFGPDDVQVGAANTVVKGTGAGVKKLKALQSGEYRVVVTGNGTEGNYSAVISWASRTAFPLPLQLAGNPKRFEFVADANATASFKVSAGKGNSLPRLFELRDAGDATIYQFPQPVPGAKTHAAKNVALGQGGTLALLVNDTGGGDPFLGSVTVKQPKSLKRKLSLIGSVLPPLGGDALAAILGPEGGLLEATTIPAIGGASVSIPPGALGSATAIVIGESTTVVPSDVTIVGAGPSVFFGPEGLQFLAGLSATIRIPYDDGTYPGGAGLRVFTRDAEGVVSEITPVTVDVATSTISVATSHFSSFQAFGVPPQPPPAPPQLAKLVQSGADAGDRFGISCSVDGPRLVVGEFFGDVIGVPADVGTARVFVDTGTAWTEEAQLSASQPAVDDRYGESVAIEKDTVVVSASLRDTGPTDCGSVFVYGRSGSQWFERQELRATDAITDAHLGQAVAISNGTIVAGATQAKDANSVTKGGVYVFRLSVSQFEQEQKIVPADGLQFGGAGQTVAIDGDTLAFGRGAFSGGSGAVWIYTRSGTTWTLQQKLEADVPVANDEFGEQAISLSGDTIAIGVRRQGQVPAASPEVYVFTRSGTTWTKEKVLTLTAITTATQYGASLALEGNTVYIGASLASGPGGANTGFVAIFQRSGTLWSPPRILRPDDSASGQTFGSAVAASPQFLVVGSIQQNALAGAAYVFSSGQ